MVLNALLLNLAVVLISFILVWVWQLKSKNAGVVDALWGVIFPIQALIYFITIGNFSLKNGIILSLIIFWGMRLGIYLAIRNIGKDEDKRYTQIRTEAGERANQKILSFYLIQAILAFSLFLPVYFIFRNSATDFTAFDITGIALLAFAAIFEALADEQLRSFKSKPENKGQICNRGLWYYSRHPNYFFEWLAWVGIAIMALNIPWGVLSFVSPLIMYHLLNNVTGISLTETTILSTKEDKYRVYIQTTSAFFPWKKRI